MRPMSYGHLFDETRGAAKRKVISHDGWRVGMSLVLIALTSSMTNYLSVALFGAPLLFAVGASGMSLRYVAGRLALMVPFGICTLVLLPLATGSETWGMAGLVLAKLVFASLGLTFMMGTTPVPQLLRTFVKLKLPAPLTEMIGFTLRYISVLSEEAMAMLTAQKARGLAAASLTNIRSYRRMGRLLGVLLVRSLDKSTRIHGAMLSRGYQAGKVLEIPPVPQAANLEQEKKETKRGSHMH